MRIFETQQIEGEILRQDCRFLCQFFANFPAKTFLAALDRALLLRRPFQYLPDEFSTRLAAHVVGDVLALHAIFRDERECVEFQRPRFRMPFIDTAHPGLIIRPMPVLYDDTPYAVPLDAPHPPSPT